jgi:hypothetical protein
MKRVVASVVLLIGIMGCQSPMRTVLSLQDGKVTPGDSFVVSEKGTYYLYSSVDEKDPIYKVDLRKGDELGFSTHGDRAHATAKGIRIELSDFSEGANYFWKMEEKKEK